MGITSSNDSNEELQIAARNNDKSTVKTLMSNKATAVKCVDSKTNRVSFNLYIPVYTVVYKSIYLSINLYSTGTSCFCYC